MIGLAAALLALPVGGPAWGDDRREEARRAEREFAEVQLFAGGRGLHITPGLYHLYDLVERPEFPLDFGWAFRWLGFHLEGRRVAGLFGVDYRGSRVGVLGCAGCHSGRAAGRSIVGLGNKTIDVALVAAVVQAFARPFQWTEAFFPEHDRRLIEDMAAFTETLRDPRRANRTRGLVPIAMIQHWFYRQAGRAMPVDLPAAWVKVPHLWGYGEKRRAGLFSDGFGDGAEPGWAAMVELAGGQTAEAVRRYRDRLEEVEAGLERLLPPPYPFAIDAERAAHGRRVFARVCASCHGNYRRDAQGLPVFEEPRHIAWEAVGTDPERLRCVTPEFRYLVATSPLADMVRGLPRPAGYFAPRLEGVWARFPYLHNASVPTIHALLSEPAERPQAFSLGEAGEWHRFDPEALGVAAPARGSEEEAALLRWARRGWRSVYWTARPGHSNQGHAFGVSLPESDKKALIEYLKTL